MTISRSTHDAFSNAIENGELSTATRLITANPALVSHPDWTPPPLHCAVLWNQPEIAALLLDNGADIEMRDPDRQTTPLRYAIMYAKKTLVRLLVSRGADSGAMSDGGLTAMELAQSAARGEYEEYEDLPSREAYQEIVDLLVELGLN